MEARAGLVECLPAGGVLAPVREQLQTQQHVLVAIRARLDLPWVVVVMMVAGRTVPVPSPIARCSSPDRILPRRRARICTAGHEIHIGREERTGGRSRGRHREVRGACSGSSFSGAWMSVSDRASWGRAIQHMRSPESHREVIVRLQGHDAFLNSNPGYYAITVVDDVRIG